MRRMPLPVSLGEGVRLWATDISKDIEARHRTQALKDDLDPTRDVCACEFQDAFRENLGSVGSKLSITAIVDALTAR